MKIPKAVKLPSGNWRIRLRLGGEEIPVIRKTETECKNAANLIKAEYLAGKRIKSNREAGDKTVQEIQEEYIKANRAILSPSTVKGYEQMAKWRWGDYKGRTLKRIKWQDMINDELDEVSPKTVKNAWGLLSASMRYAEYPVPNVRLAPCPVREIDFLQPDEIPVFLDEIKDKRYEVAALLLLHGLRVSEVRGLKWKNVDVKHGVLHIRGAVVEGPNGFTPKETNKNRTSTRDVPIMIPRLSELLETGGPKDDYVVTLCSSVLLRDVKRASEHAVGREITSHGLRHSWSSLMYDLGISERQLMSWGGWSDIQTMHKVYIRLAATAENRAKDTVTAFFKGNQNDHENGTNIEKSQ